MILQLSRDLGTTVVRSYRRLDKLFRKHLIITKDHAKSDDELSYKVRSLVGF